MDINTHEKFNTLIVGIQEYAPPPQAWRTTERPDLIGLMVTEVDSGSHFMIFTLSAAIFYILRAALPLILCSQKQRRKCK